MAYCTTTNVDTIMKAADFGLNTTDETTFDTVDSLLIPASDQEIDSVLRDLHTVAVTNTNDLKWLKWVGMRLTAGKIAQYLFGERAEPQVQTVLLGFEEAAQEDLLRLRSGEVKLEASRSALVDKGIYSVYDSDDQTKIEPKVQVSREF